MGNMISAEKYTPAVAQQTPVGAVMVIGGGIAGIQAALDLADQGFKVHLVEKKSAIGGHMAQLDKTFPTNDCAMCSISPKLVSAGRHTNIEILTDTLCIAGLAISTPLNVLGAVIAPLSARYLCQIYTKRG
jgi:heterodisulfide reductase subunit A-like polyferredoxin